MEFDCDLSIIFGQSPIVCLTPEFARSVNIEKFPQLRDVIHYMGALSAKSQSLLTPVTTYESFCQSPGQKLYFIWEHDEIDRHKSYVLGMCKVGTKLLFLHNSNGQLGRYQARCLLDIYIYHSNQRSGQGKRLLDAVLQTENLLPYTLAIDRPSSALLNFLRKHYCMVNPYRHANSFVTYAKFFEHYSPSGSHKSPVHVCKLVNVEKE